MKLYRAEGTLVFSAPRPWSLSQPLSLLLFLSLVELKRGGLMEQLHPVNSRPVPYTPTVTRISLTVEFSHTLTTYQHPQFCSIDRRPEYIESFGIISLVRVVSSKIRAKKRRSRNAQRSYRNVFRSTERCRSQERKRGSRRVNARCTSVVHTCVALFIDKRDTDTCSGD